MNGAGAEFLFYHLDGRSLEHVLPTLLEKTLQRGWKAVIQGGHRERIDALDQLLWTYDEDSFIPHGTAKAGKPELQPIYLTDGNENPNAADVRFLVAGASAEASSGHMSEYVRVVLIFDGNDEHELTMARLAWKALRSTGANASYWQQSNSGGWEKKA